MSWKSLLLTSGCAFFACKIFAAPAHESLTTVPRVDLQRYLGRWYEIARYPNSFQKDCASSVTADYSLRSDGKVTVLNQCKKPNGQIKKARGKAKVVDKVTNARLKVTFFWPFYGDYWIIDLGPEYEYAVVSEPKRKYLWILSRTPQLPSQMYEAVLERIRTKGFDTSRLVLTPQP
jgi:apolipoprotein D and lipocalin family protein